MEEEISQIRAMLVDLSNVLKEEHEAHKTDVTRLWSFITELLKHHDSMSSDVHHLITDSEHRIDSTNRMIHGLSESCNQLVEINGELKRSYVSQFDSANKQNEHLLAENARLLKENEAYYTALKQERERNDQIMQSMVSFLCNGRNSQPLVNIDQKPNI